MKSFSHFTGLVSEAIEAENFSADPAGLYDPIAYVMGLGGKRLRPALAALACQMYCGDAGPALNPAIGIELFHNFTLLHDDIMDLAPIRRGKPTVHEKWNANTAILSGDTMFAMACTYLCKAPASSLAAVLDTFNKTAIEVCEGQQLDMDFELLEEVEEDEYIRMITLKTAVLLAASLSIGACCGGAGKIEAQDLYRFGINLGIAFQLKDDLLDVYGDTKSFGKRIGGDILDNKKTYLHIKALQHSNPENRARIVELYSRNDMDPQSKIDEVISLFSIAGAEKLTEEAMNGYHSLAVKQLQELTIPEEGRVILRELADRVISRES